MKKSLLLAFFSLFALTANISVAQEGIKDEWVRSKMDDYSIVGASIAVVDDYKVIYSKGFGYRDQKKKLPVTPNTLFNAASISKPVSALVALMAYKENHLSLDDDINRVLQRWHLDESSYSDKKVSMRRLLEHSAGITGFRCIGYKQSEKTPNIIELLNGLPPANTPKVTLENTPGKAFLYSPAGYMIIQAALMDIYKQPFDLLMKERLLGKLGMKHSTFTLALKGQMKELASKSYLPDGSEIPEGPMKYPSSAAGGLWTTSNDLTKVILAIQGKKFISDDILNEFLTPGVSNNMGLGIEVNLNKHGQHVEEGNYFGHSGWNSGYIGFMLGDRLSGVGVVILINTAPYMTEKGPVKQFDFITDVIKEVAKTYKWPD